MDNGLTSARTTGNHNASTLTVDGRGIKTNIRKVCRKKCAFIVTVIVKIMTIIIIFCPLVLHY